MEPLLRMRFDNVVKRVPVSAVGKHLPAASFQVCVCVCVCVFIFSTALAIIQAAWQLAHVHDEFITVRSSERACEPLRGSNIKMTSARVCVIICSLWVCVLRPAKSCSSRRVTNWRTLILQTGRRKFGKSVWYTRGFVLSECVCGENCLCDVVAL